MPCPQWVYAHGCKALHLALASGAVTCMAGAGRCAHECRAWHLVGMGALHPALATSGANTVGTQRACNAEPSACVCITAGADTCMVGMGRGLWPHGKMVSAILTVSATALPPETPMAHACSTSQDCIRTCLVVSHYGHVAKL